jgi:hypothetical protein
VLLADGTASVYILDIEGDRQAFMTQVRSATTDERAAELPVVIDSIDIEPWIRPDRGGLRAQDSTR